MARTFEAQVSAWVRKSERRIEAVFKESAQRVINEARGNTPVDTGTLRASLTATLNAPITDIQFRTPDASVPDDGGSSIAAVIAGASAGDTVFAVYSMAYSVHVEYGARGRSPVRMVGRAAANWQSIVRAVSAEAKARVG